MKKSAILTLCTILGLLLLSIFIYKKQLDRKVILEKEQEQQLIKEAAEKEAAERAKKRFKAKADEAFIYAKTHNFDLKHAILVDFSIHSGKKRFFVWNFETNNIELSSLVAHGYGDDNYRSSQTEIVFSNMEGSFASSLGKYKMGIRFHSKWGINVHYKLHGLEESNSNAFKRIIVLHSYKDIPENVLYPEYLPLGYSQGCPVIDNKTMQQVDDLMKTKHKPVLFWIYN